MIKKSTSYRNKIYLPNEPIVYMNCNKYLHFSQDEFKNCWKMNVLCIISKQYSILTMFYYNPFK